jgi:hypothetical protein
MPILQGIFLLLHRTRSSTSQVTELALRTAIGLSTIFFGFKMTLPTRLMALDPMTFRKIFLPAVQSVNASFQDDTRACLCSNELGTIGSPGKPLI